MTILSRLPDRAIIILIFAACTLKFMHSEYYLNSDEFVFYMKSTNLQHVNTARTQGGTVRAS